jgi:hypothetical protein
MPILYSRVVNVRRIPRPFVDGSMRVLVIVGLGPIIDDLLRMETAGDLMIDLFASVTGNDVSDDPFDPSNPNEQAGDIRSYCRGWLLRWGKFGLGGALRFSDYIAEQDEKFPELQTLVGRCFGNSNAIGHSERRKAGW